MIVKVSGKNIEVTTVLRNTIEAKLDKFGRYFKEDTAAQATLSVQKIDKLLRLLFQLMGLY